MTDDGKNKKKILVVDDYESIRATLAALLGAVGYDVETAEDGFAALLRLKNAIPDLILSDLNMPHMSGFEFLSVVRRRFPQVPVVAMSGAYGSGDAVPGGVLADAFYGKIHNSSQTLLEIIARVLETGSSSAVAHVRESAPVWIPQNGKDVNGFPYVVLTCTECLRSFPLTVTEEVTPAVLETPCIFCLNTVRYIIDFSLSIASPKQPASVAALGRKVQTQGHG
jgi:CheY-like chemotaxis protein